MFCENLCEIRQCAKKKGFDTCADCQEMEKCQIVGEITENNPEALNNLKENRK